MAEAKVCYLHPQALPNLKESGSVSKFDGCVCDRLHVRRLVNNYQYKLHDTSFPFSSQVCVCVCVCVCMCVCFGKKKKNLHGNSW